MGPTLLTWAMMCMRPALEKKTAETMRPRGYLQLDWSRDYERSRRTAVLLPHWLLLKIGQEEGTAERNATAWLLEQWLTSLTYLIVSLGYKKYCLNTSTSYPRLASPIINLEIYQPRSRPPQIDRDCC